MALNVAASAPSMMAATSVRGHAPRGQRREERRRKKDEERSAQRERQRETERERQTEESNAATARLPAVNAALGCIRRARSFAASPNRHASRTHPPPSLARYPPSLKAVSCTMDVAGLTALLSATMVVDANVRRHAELQLRQARPAPLSRRRSARAARRSSRPRRFQGTRGGRRGTPPGRDPPRLPASTARDRVSARRQRWWRGPARCGSAQARRHRRRL